MFWQKYTLIFLGETFENGAVQKVHILGEDDAIVLQAEEAYKDTMFKGKKKPRIPWGLPLLLFICQHTRDIGHT